VVHLFQIGDTPLIFNFLGWYTWGVKKMAIAEGKKRVQLTFDEDTLKKLDYLYHLDLKSKEKRDSKDFIYRSDTLSKIIQDAYTVSRTFN